MTWILPDQALTRLYFEVRHVVANNTTEWTGIVRRYAFNAVADGCEHSLEQNMKAFKS